MTIPPITTTVKLDKIALTVPIRDKKRVERAFRKAASKYCLSTFSKKRYKLNAEFKIGLFPEDKLLVQLMPIDDSHNFARIEYNPARFTLSETLDLRRILREIFVDEFGNIFYESKVNRLDVAVDLDNLSIDDIFPDRDDVRVSGLFNNTSGQTKTLYLGRKGQNNNTVVYDRQEKAFNHNHEVPNTKITRFEFRLSPKVPIKQLPNITIPIPNLKVYQITQLEDSGLLPAFFSDACKYRGFNATLRRFTPAKRKEIRDILVSFETDYLSVETTQAAYVKSLKRLGPLNPAFKRKPRNSGKSKFSRGGAFY